MTEISQHVTSSPTDAIRQSVLAQPSSGNESAETRGAGRPAGARNKGEGSLGWVFWFAVFWICVLVFKFTPAAGVVVFVTSFLEGCWEGEPRRRRMPDVGSASRAAKQAEEVVSSIRKTVGRVARGGGETASSKALRSGARAATKRHWQRGVLQAALDRRAADVSTDWAMRCWD